MRWGLFILCLVLPTVYAASASGAAPHNQPRVSEDELNAAIGRLQQRLFSRQDPQTGDFEGRYTNLPMYRGGESALAVFALLRSGISVQEPRMRAATGYLERVQMGGTYAVSLRAHCWAALSDDYKNRLAADARWLMKAQVEGLFDYGLRTGPRFDHSVTQYGLLGLWESGKRRGVSGGRVWRDASLHFIEQQNPDGGWGYQTGGSTATMTAAGLTALLIAQENLYRKRNTPPRRITQAINGAVAWLDHYTAANGVSSGNNYYYLVSLERVALASGIKTLGGRDWFQAGARLILNNENGTGSLGEVSDTAFALLFLSRGRVPVWINKLRLRGHPWNNRPNDLNLFTRELSGSVEAELNWQVIEADGDVGHWLDAPVAYVASDKPVSFSGAALGNLKTFVDLGGVLVATPDLDPHAFGESIKEAAAMLYPGLAFKRVGADHPLMGLVFEVDVPESQRPWVLSNGVRDLMILSPSDWGMALQSRVGARETGARGIMANLYALATDRAVGHEKRPPILVAREARESSGFVEVVRLARDGSVPVEPLAWRPLEERFFNRTGYELGLTNLPVEEVGGSGAPLVHLGGFDAQRLTADELRALTGYVNGGGVVLLETIGGRGEYASVVLKQFEAVLGNRVVPIPSEHPIVTGIGLGPGGTDGAGEGNGGGFGYDLRRIGYRRYSNLNRGPVDAPRLMVLTVDGRAALIVSQEDLSMGVLGVTRWGIDGYDVDSARKLMTNILLYAVRESAGIKPPAGGAFEEDAPSEGHLIDTKMVPADGE